MTRRLEAGFRRRFRDLLALVRPRRLDFGVELLMGRGRDRAVRENQPLVAALTTLYLFTRQRVARRLVVTGACTLPEAPWERFRAVTPSFLCDGSLGGLARWLRAAGYETVVAGDAAVVGDAAARRGRREHRGASSGDRLLEEAAAARRVLLTSEAELLDRLKVRDGVVAALWVPTGLDPTAQLGLVVADLGLGLREPRCMSCGGVLQAQTKEAVAERIPPRTARWKDDYWTCRSCSRLFWKGTHWERIARALAGVAGAGARAA
jgi:uncharacterized protein with PIN domain